MARAKEILWGEKKRFPSSSLRFRYKSKAKALLPRIRSDSSDSLTSGEVSRSTAERNSSAPLGVDAAGSDVIAGLDGPEHAASKAKAARHMNQSQLKRFLASCKAQSSIIPPAR